MADADLRWMGDRWTARNAIEIEAKSARKTPTLILYPKTNVPAILHFFSTANFNCHLNLASSTLNTHDTHRVFAFATSGYLADILYSTNGRLKFFHSRKLQDPSRFHEKFLRSRDFHSLFSKLLVRILYRRSSVQSLLVGILEPSI